MIIILDKDFDRITMQASGVDKDGKTHKLHGTYALEPSINFYDETEHRWLSKNEWAIK